MAKELIAERIIEDSEEGAGGMARYALYGAAAAAALLGAWLIAGNASTEAPAPALLAHTEPMPINEVRQIDMSQTASIAPDTATRGAAVATAPVAALPVAAAPAATETASIAADAPMPPLPVPRPARPVAAAAPAVQRNVVVAEREAPIVQKGAPPSDLGVLRETSTYAAAPAPQPVYAPVVAAASDGPVPPMPIDDTVYNAPPVGTNVRHQGLLGASERAVGTAWNWTTGAVNGAVNGVKQAF